MHEDGFELWDLELWDPRVGALAPDGAIPGRAAVPGEDVERRDGVPSLSPGRGVSIPSLAALRPSRPARRRHPGAGMTNGVDSDRLSRFRLTRAALRRCRRADVTAGTTP